MKSYLANQMQYALANAAASAGVQLPEGFALTLEVPKDPSHGDFSSNAAMQLAGTFRKAPRAIAELLVKAWEDPKGWFDAPEIAGPGFINFRAKAKVWQDTLEEIVTQGAAYGRKQIDTHDRILIEFVSANPTGTLNVVNARAASLGDVLARLFEASGHVAHREFYINDHGVQTKKFGESLRARIREIEGKEWSIPEGGYEGAYVKDLAQEFHSELEKAGKTSDDVDVETFRVRGTGEMVKLQKAVLEQFGVHFQEWFPESRLHQAGAVESTLQALKDRGEVYEGEGAVWLRTSTYGDEKDRILIKSDGQPTYFLADIAYHWDKFQRGYTKLIDIWGPDHHGHVIRMMAAMQALGLPADALTILIAQMVRLKSGDEYVKFSKRRGDIYTMKDLIEETSVDAMRWFFIMRRFDSHLDFDLDLAKEQSDKNPVFYVQYAHARICSIFVTAEKKGVEFNSGADLTLLNEDVTLQLIKLLARFPDVIESAAVICEPHRVCTYLHELCGMFHGFYTQHIVVDPAKPELSQARLYLAQGVRTVLRNGLELLGISAPERM